MPVPSRFSNPPRILETIPEESELNISAAELDEDRQDSIIVEHKASGRKIIVSKTFKNAEKFNDNDSDITPIDPDAYLLENIDKKNVRVGVFRSKTTGEVAKVKRNFNGAVVLDFQSDGKWCIGKTVRKEDDYDFAHAFEDPDDPEAVVAWNKIGKVYCVIKKDFKGLPKLDPKTNLPIFTERMVSNYELDSIQIDSRNPHFANLIADGNVVRVRRNFIGAKVVKVLTEEEFTEKIRKKAEVWDEPEKELELKTEDLDFYEPDILVPTPSQKFKKPKKLKIKKPSGWQNTEAIYLQRLEPSLKPSKAYHPGSGNVSPLDESHITNLNMKAANEIEFEILRK